MKTTLDELKAFVAVVDSGSITAAAEALELTISATAAPWRGWRTSCRPRCCDGPRGGWN